MQSIILKSIRLISKQNLNSFNLFKRPLNTNIKLNLFNLHVLHRVTNQLNISTTKIYRENLKKIVEKPRLTKKKSKKSSTSITTNPTFVVKAYATADFYNLDLLEEALKKTEAYEILDNFARDIPDNCLVARSKYPELNEIEPRYLFFFEEGAVVLWNCSEEEQNNILEMLNKISEKYYPSDIVNDESEMLTFSRNLLPLSSLESEINITYAKSKQDNPDYLLSGDSTSLNLTRLFKNHIYFKEFKNLENRDAERENLLERYAFSDAIALSCMLGIWEKKLENFTEKIEYIAEDLKRGEKIKLKTEDVLQKMGELFTMRHMINLNSNYLETPDFYWDRENLENLYTQIYYHLSVSKRTRLFNNRLNDCIDLMQILKEHLNDKKHTRLEWIIIGLIAIEASAALGLFDFIKSFLH